jgi:hypothetical protein
MGRKNENFESFQLASPNMIIGTTIACNSLENIGLPCEDDTIDYNWLYELMDYKSMIFIMELFITKKIDQLYYNLI